MRRLVPLLALLAACGPDSETDRAPRALFDAPAAGATAPPPALEISEDAPTVLFMGDSFGAGLHLAEHQAFPAVLQRRLFAAGQPFHLVNASESGRTSSGGLTGIEWSLRSEPDLVVIELGGNDGLRGIDPETTETNLRGIIEASQAAGAKVLLLGIRLPLNFSTYAEEFDAIYPRLAEEYDLAFVPFFMDGVGGNPDLTLPDGLHPTAEGQIELAKNMEAGLAAALKAL